VQIDTKKKNSNLFTTREQLILASASPRRRRFLEGLGLIFTIEAAQVDEQPLAHEPPREFVLRAATDKARAVAERHPDAWVLGADTVVVLDNQILGKPVDEEDANRLLALLTGRWHEVLTGFCMCRKDREHQVAHAVATTVKFVNFDEKIAAAYVQTGEPLDKAGAYGIQGKGGFLVERINGSYSNVVGLPLAEVVEELLQLGIIVPAPEPDLK
jgi:septum formation protein